MVIDQAHQQNNATVKEDGEAVGLTQSIDFMRWCTAAGPELAHKISEFEVTSDSYDIADQEVLCHHEQFDRLQTTFTQQAKELVEVIEDMGNPFK